jgi:vitamin B12 transporter
MRVIAACTIALSLVTASATAQDLFSITGIISDATGAAVAGATVDVVIAGRIVEHTTTGADGRYLLTVPARVPYEVRAHQDGFAEATVRAPGTSGAASHNLTLQIGGVSDTLIVTASRGAESRAGVTAATTVVTAEELRDLGSASLVDALRFVPGLAAEGAGREGAMTSVFSRGGESDYNLVLIDGVRVNQSGGVFDFSRISAAEIDRVEVVRGAQSALWGSDAMGSVVQIFTRRAGAADRPQVSGSAEGGSFGAFRGDARLAGGASSRVDYSGCRKMMSSSRPRSTPARAPGSARVSRCVPACARPRPTASRSAPWCTAPAIPAASTTRAIGPVTWTSRTPSAPG